MKIASSRHEPTIANTEGALAAKASDKKKDERVDTFLTGGVGALSGAGIGALAAGPVGAFIGAGIGLAYGGGGAVAVDAIEKKTENSAMTIAPMLGAWLVFAPVLLVRNLIHGLHSK